MLNILWFFGIISVALGLTNLLPIPALDGGRILFVIPELIARKRVPAEYENAVHMIGFTFLLALMAFLFLQDSLTPWFCRNREGVPNGRKREESPLFANLGGPDG